jgi:hypothetical protein
MCTAIMSRSAARGVRFLSISMRKGKKKKQENSFATEGPLICLPQALSLFLYFYFINELVIFVSNFFIIHLSFDCSFYSKINLFI